MDQGRIEVKRIAREAFEKRRNSLRVPEEECWSRAIEDRHIGCYLRIENETATGSLLFVSPPPSIKV
jgi:hypothetical protein